MFNNELLRQVRKEKEYTLAKLSEESGYTASFLSQVERGLKEPSLSSLQTIAGSLGVPVVIFFSDYTLRSGNSNNKPYEIIRKEEFKGVMVPGLKAKFNMITPIQASHMSNKTNKAIGGFFYVMDAGKWCSEEMISHAVDESIYIISGKMKVNVSNEIHFLSAGDSIYIYAHTPHNFHNCGDDELSWIMYISQEN